MSREHIEQPKKYYTIVGGTFRVQVPETDPAAVRRDWKSADGTASGTKYERIVNALFGYIEDVAFFAGDFGEQLIIKLDFNEQQQQPTIALAMNSREAEDFLKRLPNIDLDKEVRLRPFNFTSPQDGEEVRGIEIMQPDEQGDFKVKVGNFFYKSEKQPDGSIKRDYLNGFPAPDGDTSEYSKDDWKIYFLTARKFLVNYTKQNICPKFQHVRRAPATRATEPVVGSDPDAIDAAFEDAFPETK